MIFLMIFLLIENEINYTFQDDSYIFNDAFECFIFFWVFVQICYKFSVGTSSCHSHKYQINHKYRKWLRKKYICRKRPIYFCKWFSHCIWFIIAIIWLLILAQCPGSIFIRVGKEWPRNKNVNVVLSYCSGPEKV